MSRRLIPTIGVMLLVYLPVQAQSLEIQAYPAGIIGVVGYTVLSPDQMEVRFHAGVNLTDRRDWGDNDSETGSGFGGGVDLSWFFLRERPALWVGARVDVWALTIDWRNDSPPSSGDSRIVVLQPTARAGLRKTIGVMSLDFTLGLGAEINTVVHGRDVGQGAILLAGLRLTL